MSVYVCVCGKKETKELNAHIASDFFKRLNGRLRAKQHYIWQLASLGQYVATFTVHFGSSLALRDSRQAVLFLGG